MSFIPYALCDTTILFRIWCEPIRINSSYHHFISRNKSSATQHLYEWYSDRALMATTGKGLPSMRIVSRFKEKLQTESKLHINAF